MAPDAFVIERFSHFDGVCRLQGSVTVTGDPVVAVGVSLPDRRTRWFDSSVTVTGDMTRFDVQFAEEQADLLVRCEVGFLTRSGALAVISDLAGHAMFHDPYHRLNRRFFDSLRDRAGISVLEIGSRNRSGHVRTGLVGAGASYVGLDIMEGDNVDVVGDAHDLARHFPAASFDAVFSISTFEHLLMPWRVALEINRVLKPGGVVFVATHQSFALHEQPADFWRFSDTAWQALFNRATGFEIDEAALGEPVHLVASMLHPVTAWLDRAPAFLGSAVLAHKIGPTSLAWDVRPDDVATLGYRDDV